VKKIRIRGECHGIRSGSCSSRGVRASAGVEVTIIVSRPMETSWPDELRTKYNLQL